MVLASLNQLQSEIRAASVLFCFFNREGEATAEKTYSPRALALAINVGTPGGPECMISVNPSVRGLL